MSEVHNPNEKVLNKLLEAFHIPISDKDRFREKAIEQYRYVWSLSDVPPIEILQTADGLATHRAAAGNAYRWHFDKVASDTKLYQKGASGWANQWGKLSGMLMASVDVYVAMEPKLARYIKEEWNGNVVMHIKKNIVPVLKQWFVYYEVPNGLKQLQEAMSNSLTNVEFEQEQMDFILEIIESFKD